MPPHAVRGRLEEQLGSGRRVDAVVRIRAHRLIGACLQASPVGHAGRPNLLASDRGADVGAIPRLDLWALLLQQLAELVLRKPQEGVDRGTVETAPAPVLLHVCGAVQLDQVPASGRHDIRAQSVLQAGPEG